jgi:hypothetical protein
MANDSMCVQQTPHSRVPLHPPADDRGVAPGAARHEAAPPPAAHEPKLLVPGPAKDTEAAQKQAKTASQALTVAKLNLAKLVRENAPPAEISAAEHLADIEQEKAELATVHDAIVQREDHEQRLAILRLADNEVTRLLQHPNPSPSAAEKLHFAVNNVLKASKDVDDSRDRFVDAKKMLYAVAGRDVRPAPATDAATDKYPNLVIAKGKFLQATEQFNSSKPKNIKQNLAKVQAAAAEWRTAWAVVRDGAKGRDTEFRNACDVGFAIAQDNFNFVTNPQWVKSQESP